MNRQTLAAKKWHRSDIVFPIMQHSNCNSPLADMLSSFNNTSMDLKAYTLIFPPITDASLFQSKFIKKEIIKKAVRLSLALFWINQKARTVDCCTNKKVKENIHLFIIVMSKCYNFK